MKTRCIPMDKSRQCVTTAKWLNCLGDDDDLQSFVDGKSRSTNNPRGRKRKDGTFGEHTKVTNFEIRRRHIDRGLVRAKGVPKREKLLELLTFC